MKHSKQAQLWKHAANARRLNSTSLFALSSASYADVQKCAKDCKSDEEGEEECIFENCPEYVYCDDPEDREVDPAICEAVFKGSDEAIKICKEEDEYDAADTYCEAEFPEYSSDRYECIETLRETFKAAEREKCYGDVDRDDLRSYQKKCASHCSSEYDSPSGIRHCAGTCRAYSKCPADSNSDYKDKCIKEANEECEKWYEGDADAIAKCKKPVEKHCKRAANTLCPTFPVWAIVVIVVCVVVVVAAAVVVVLVVLKLRKPKVAASDSDASTPN